MNITQAPIEICPGQTKAKQTLQFYIRSFPFSPFILLFHIQAANIAIFWHNHNHSHVCFIYCRAWNCKYSGTDCFFFWFRCFFALVVIHRHRQPQTTKKKKKRNIVCLCRCWWKMSIRNGFYHFCKATDSYAWDTDCRCHCENVNT